MSQQANTNMDEQYSNIIDFPYEIEQLIIYNQMNHGYFIPNYINHSMMNMGMNIPFSPHVEQQYAISETQPSNTPINMSTPVVEENTTQQEDSTTKEINSTQESAPDETSRMNEQTDTVSCDSKIDTKETIASSDKRQSQLKARKMRYFDPMPDFIPLPQLTSEDTNTIEQPSPSPVFKRDLREVLNTIRSTRTTQKNETINTNSQSDEKSIQSHSNVSHVRTRSPVRYRERTRSPVRYRERTRSPVRYRERSRSPVRYRERSRSPVRYRERSRSPVRYRERSRSPVRYRERSRSPVRYRERSRSPVRYRERSRSPVHHQFTKVPVYYPVAQNTNIPCNTSMIPLCPYNTKCVNHKRFMADGITRCFYHHTVDTSEVHTGIQCKYGKKCRNIKTCAFTH